MFTRPAVGLLTACVLALGVLRPTHHAQDESALVVRAKAIHDRVVTLDATTIRPHVTWGTSPEMVVAIDERVPDPEKEKDPVKREGMERALVYMGLSPNTEIQKIIFHLRDRGIGILITDHNVLQTLKITDRAYIVTDGAIFRSGTPAALAADEEVRRIYLGADFRLD